MAFPESFTLSTNSACNNNIIFTGENSGDQSGWSVSSIGDLNGDSKPELIIGAYNYLSTDAQGATYVVSGSIINLVMGGIIPLAPSAGIVRFIGENSGDQSGYSVSSIGDLNGDTKPELIIGTPGYPPSNYNGATYVVSGASINLATGGSVTLTPGTGIVRFVGENNIDQSGWSVSSIGDLNGDNITELLIGANGYLNGNSNGATYVVSGASINLATSGSVILTPGAGIVRFVGESNSDYAGTSVSSIGDLNGDNITELLIGAPVYLSGNYQGATYVVSGSSINLATGGSVTLIPGTNIVRFVGENNSDQLGWSVSSIGDLNGDTKPELLIGAPGYLSGNSNGATYVVSGSSINLATGGSVTLTPGAGIVRFVGENAGSQSGYSVSSIKDLNGDSKPELIIGAPGYASNNNNGATYVVSGASINLDTGGSITLTPAAGIGRLTGQNIGDKSGASVSSIGDLNGDTKPELLIGAYNYLSGDGGGATYILSGNALNPCSLPSPSPSVSPSASSSPSQSPSASPSKSPSFSPSSSISPSTSPSSSLSFLLSLNALPSPSPSASPSKSSSSSLSPSISPSTSPSSSSSLLLSLNASPSPSPSVSSSKSPSSSSSPSISPSASPSPSPSVSLNSSPSASILPSPSVNLGASPSLSNSPSKSPSVLASPNKSANISPAASVLCSPSASPSSSHSPSVIKSPNAIPLASDSPSPSVSPDLIVETTTTNTDTTSTDNTETTSTQITESQATNISNSVKFVQTSTANIETTTATGTFTATDTNTEHHGGGGYKEPPQMFGINGGHLHRDKNAPEQNQARLQVKDAPSDDSSNSESVSTTIPFNAGQILLAQTAIHLIKQGYNKVVSIWQGTSSEEQNVSQKMLPIEQALHVLNSYSSISSKLENIVNSLDLNTAQDKALVDWLKDSLIEHKKESQKLMSQELISEEAFISYCQSMQVLTNDLSEQLEDLNITSFNKLALTYIKNELAITSIKLAISFQVSTDNMENTKLSNQEQTQITDNKQPILLAFATSLDTNIYDTTMLNTSLFMLGEAD